MESKYTAIVSARLFRSGGDEYVYCGIRDVTDQIRQEHEHSMRDEELRRLFATMAQGRIPGRKRNDRLCQSGRGAHMLGLSLQQLTQRSSLTPEWKAIREDGSPCRAASTPR